MAKKDFGSRSSASEDVALEAEVVAPVVAPPVASKPRISFDMWFQSSDRSAAGMTQPHHKQGMKAFANTKGKRTKDEWDSIFARY